MRSDNEEKEEEDNTPDPTDDDDVSVCWLASVCRSVARRSILRIGRLTAGKREGMAAIEGREQENLIGWS